MPRLILNFKEADTKTELIKEIFTSLRHSTVIYLLLDGAKTPTEIAKEMNISRTAITLTLNKFLEIGLIEKKKEGKEVFYRANNERGAEIVKDIILKNIKERHPAIEDKIDYDKVSKLFEREDIKSLLGLCCAKVAKEKRYPMIRIIDDFLNTVHIVYMNAAVHKNVCDLDARETLIRMNKELKSGLDELMKVYLTYPANNYREHLEWFKKII